MPLQKVIYDRLTSGLLFVTFCPLANKITGICTPRKLMFSRQCPSNDHTFLKQSNRSVNWFFIIKLGYVNVDFRNLRARVNIYSAFLDL